MSLRLQTVRVASDEGNEVCHLVLARGQPWPYWYTSTGRRGAYPRIGIHQVSAGPGRENPLIMLGDLRIRWTALRRSRSGRQVVVPTVLSLHMLNVSAKAP